MNKFLTIIIALLMVGLAEASDVTDTLDDAGNCFETLNSDASANGDSTVSLTMLAAGESVVDWHSSSYMRLQICEQVEVDPVSSINGGEYSLWLVFFNSGRQYLGEYQWYSGSSTETRISPSMVEFIANHGLDTAKYYWLRIRLHGGTGQGFKFDEIRVRTGLGYWKPTALTQSAAPAVFAHFMVGFKTTDYSGQWGGWDYSNACVSHNPSTFDAQGKRDIASVYYPSVGCYDMNDPDLVEYHCQLMKMAELDGAIFDLTFYDMSPANISMMNAYMSGMTEYGLQSVVCYEDKVHWLWDNPATRAIAVNRAYGDMDNWLNMFINSSTQYYVSGSRPLCLMFSYEQYDETLGTSCLSPTEITSWLSGFAGTDQPVMLRQWFKDPDHVGVLNGQFDWVKISSPAPAEQAPYVAYTDWDDAQNYLLANRAFGQYLLATDKADFHIPVVYPGFDDLEIQGWDCVSGPRLIPRYDGALYDMVWDWAIEDDLPVVQVCTWNDWYEGTIIEPAVEFGNMYMEKTRARIEEFKGATPSTVNFNVPVWIYKLRNICPDDYVLTQLDVASDLIKQGQYTSAEAIVSPWAAAYGVDGITYWKGQASRTNLQTGILQADISAYDFASQPVGATQTVNITLENTDAVDLVFVGEEPIEIIGDDGAFSIVEPVDVSDLAGSQNRVIQIICRPFYVGTANAILRLRSTDIINSPLEIPLTVNATQTPGDYNGDQKVDALDFAVLAEYWGEPYCLVDLLEIANYWLN